jgi:hypothetical protein
MRSPESASITIPLNAAKRVLTKNDVGDWIRIDRNRMDAILPLLRFDEDEKLTYIPPWGALQELATRIRIEKIDASGMDAEQSSFDLPLLEQKTSVMNLEELGDPCNSCESYCCKTLIFPQQIPTTSANLDFIRFSLGFPGVMVSVGPAGWTLIVKTRCRHLELNKCTIYGKPERPLICKYYDSWKCTYRSQFGYLPGKGSVNIEYGDFEKFISLFAFDQDGNVVSGPSGVEEIQSAIT